MILAILFAYLGYKKANEAGKNGILWAVLAGGSFIATQLIVALGIGVIIGLGIATLGWSEELLTAYEIVITIVAIIVSIGVAYLVLKLAERNPVEETMTMPPPPTDFNLRG
jgi:cytochrome bd-type quinol oxidase subunit 2